MSDGDLRMLGARDGYAHALVRVRQSISRLAGRYSPGIHPRHVRKLAARDAKVKLLREIEEWLVERHSETRDAYLKTTQPQDFRS